MAGLIRQADIEEVKARTNIGDILGEYVTLKSAGVGSLKGLCPFHDERSPSFHVRPQVGFYHCFGCGESGDVYSFLQKMDHVTFAESVERLAARLGYELHYEDGGSGAGQTSNRARVLAANQLAAEFFQSQLGTPGADVGRRFLGERGFDAQAAGRFGVGFAPQGWDGLTLHMRGHGYSDEELVVSGLVSAGNRGVYDRFRGRLVWPIRDVTGQTIGFGARKLLEDDKGPKYLNTPETPVYHKSQVLYGLDLAKREISRSRRVVVVEGYTDVMACHLAGVTTAVATCGTAFGVDHIKILRRILGDDTGLGEVIFTFDPDAAGEKAAMRAFTEERRFTAQTYVAVAPDGLDPCDLRLKRGDEAVQRMIDGKKPMFEFVMRQILARFNLDTVEGRVGALRQAAPVVSEIRDPALRPGYTRELARMLGMELGEVSRAVSQAGRTGTQPASGHARTGRGETADPAEHGNDGEPIPAPGVVGLMQLPTDAATRLERDGLMAMLQYAPLIGRDLVDRAARTGFFHPDLATVRDGIAASIDAFDSPEWITRVIDAVPETHRDLVKQLSVAPVPERAEREMTLYVRDVTTGLIDRHLVQQKSELLGRLQRVGSDDRDEFNRVQRALVDVEIERRALRV